MRSGKDAKRGLYSKFIVERTDGSSREGEKHGRCKYFVLDLTHDQFARPALIAYAVACTAKFPKLAADLYAIADGDRQPLRKVRGLPPLRVRR